MGLIWPWEKSCTSECSKSNLARKTNQMDRHQFRQSQKPVTPAKERNPSEGTSFQRRNVIPAKAGISMKDPSLRWGDGVRSGESVFGLWRHGSVWGDGVRANLLKVA